MKEALQSIVNGSIHAHQHSATITDFKRETSRLIDEAYKVGVRDGRKEREDEHIKARAEENTARQEALGGEEARSQKGPAADARRNEKAKGETQTQGKAGGKGKGKAEGGAQVSAQKEGTIASQSLDQAQAALGADVGGQGSSQEGMAHAEKERQGQEGGAPDEEARRKAEALTSAL